MKKRSAVLLIVFISAVTAALVFSAPKDIKRVYPENGSINLMSDDVLQTPVSIDPAGFSYYPDRLYAPENFAQGVFDQPVPFTQDNLNHTQYGTYYLRLRLPAGKTYAISVSSIDYAQRTFINGEEQPPVGVVGDTAASTVPGVGQCFFVFTPQSDETEIVMQYSNFNHHEGGQAYPLFLGSVQAVEASYGRSVFHTSVLSGTILVIGIFYAGVYFIYGREKYYLFFLACILAAALRTPTLALLLPGIPWTVLMTAFYLALIAMIAFFVAYLDALFPRLLHKPGKIYLYALCGLYAAVVLVTKPVVFTTLLPFFHAGALAYGIYMVIRLLTVSKGYQEESLCIVTGSVCAICVMAAGLLYYSHLETYLATSAAQASFFIFIIANMLALLFRFSKTQRQLAESQQREKELTMQNEQYDELNAIRTSFLQNIAHELKTPLTIMSGFAQLSSQKVEQDMDKEDILSDLDTMAEEAERLSDLVSHLLDISVEKHQDEYQKTEIGGLIGKAASLYHPAAERKGIVLRELVEPNLPSLTIQPERILQVLLNLLSNAVRHTETGAIEIGAVLKEQNILVFVRDTGCGIEENLLPHVFDRFVGSGKSSGLGLSISKGIINEHNGEIKIKSTVGKGTEVSFTLPVETESRVWLKAAETDNVSQDNNS